MKKLLLNKSFLLAAPLLVVPIVASGCSKTTSPNPKPKFNKDNLSTWGDTQKQAVVFDYLTRATKWINENQGSATWGKFTTPESVGGDIDEVSILEDACQQVNSLMDFTSSNKNAEFTRPVPSGVTASTPLLTVLTKGITYTVTPFGTASTNPLSGKVTFTVITTTI